VKVNKFSLPEGKEFSPLFAAGADMKAAVAYSKGKEILLSPDVGDLENYTNYKSYLSTVEKLKKVAKITPEASVCDMHPAYYSTQFAEKLGLPLIKVQHHHAHIASVMLEHGFLDPGAKFLGLAFDGTGYGTDGNIWGSEFLEASLGEFNRRGHFEYIPLIGGDKAAREPFRTALAFLYKIYQEKIYDLNLPQLNREKRRTEQLIQALGLGLNTPLSSGLGRLFDSVASLLDICQENTYPAEAPILLEQLAYKDNCKEEYPREISPSGEGMLVINSTSLIQQIVQDILQGKNKALIARKFHNTVASISLDMVKRINPPRREIFLSGGVFQNVLLSGLLEGRLTQAGYKVYRNRKVPTNDGGIAVGQLAVGNTLWQKKKS